jgi:2-methylcitrate dehydratase PrpD
MPVQEVLGNFVCDLSYKDIPSKVLLRAKYSILDTFGVILAGSRADISKQLLNFVKRVGGVKESIIFGSNFIVPAQCAATINGTLGHIDELDDGDRFALGHPGITSIPAAFSVAEKISASGKDFITGVILGYDIFSRIARSINPSHRERGFHTSATCGTFGAAIASGKILELNYEQMSSALGIAGIQAAGLGSGSGDSMLKPLGVGKSSGNGVLSAILAKLNIPTSPTIIDGERGFIRASSDLYNENKIIEGLGKEFKIMDSYVKFHASGRHIHPTIDAILDIKQKYNVNFKEVKRVLVKTYYAAANLGNENPNYRPPSPHAAKFSIPYVVAISLVKGEANEDSFTWENIKDPQILRVADKVKVIEEDELSKLVPEKRGSIVEITTRDNHKYSTKIENPNGEPENLDYNKIEDKFLRLTRKVIPEKKSKELLNKVLNFEKIIEMQSFREILLLENEED